MIASGLLSQRITILYLICQWVAGVETDETTGGGYYDIDWVRFGKGRISVLVTLAVAATRVVSDYLQG